MRKKRFGTAISLIAVLMAISGCARDDSSVAPAKREKPAARSAAANNGLRDPRSAVSTTVAFWRYVGAGALPAVWSLYDPDVLNALGPATFGGMLASQQSVAATTTLNVLDVERAAGGDVVLAELIPSLGPKTQTSFFLKRREGRWRILYDTFSANALSAFVQQQEQRRIDPTAKQPSQRSLRAAEVVVTRFREIALRQEASLQEQERAQPSRGQSAR